MRRTAGFFVAAAVFALVSTTSPGCKGKDKSDDKTTKKVTPKDPVKTPPADKAKPKDGPKVPPVPTGFAGKASAFYTDAVKVLKAEKNCAKLGAHLLTALTANQAMLKAYVGTDEGAKWRADNEALQNEFQTEIRVAIPKCAMDKTFRKWMQQIASLSGKQSRAKGDGAGAATPTPGAPAPGAPPKPTQKPAP